MENLAPLLVAATLIVSAFALSLNLPAKDALARNGQERERTGWRLIFEENFERPIGGEAAPWIRTPPGRADPFDDDGDYFHATGGADFTRQLDSFDTYRQTFRFGKDGWLTAELSARDPEKVGKPKNPPSLTNVAINGEPAALLSEPDHHGGIIIRPTHPLPTQYRIEYSLVGLDFGGSRNGQWAYSGRVNGYAENGAKTRHPWAFGPSNEIAKPYADWFGVKNTNGFYFLAIVDYPDPFPRNNVFIHTHRKVAIDAYTMAEKPSFQLCAPSGNHVTQDNTVNALFFSPGGMVESEPVSASECGTTYGDARAAPPVVSAAQLTPEVLPGERYRFAIERDRTGYTLEIQGNFRFSGKATYRFRRAFLQDGHPIWHYNQTREEYDGAYDRSFTYKGPFGLLEIPHSWPKDSAYPDFFIIGDPHTNYYEGTAAIADIRLYERD
ncbi:MAG: hypothetical protein EKK29_16180 [Hyphomicrobiales bacterium]|nr:MAG: hypothetical protein EKK29_16180 [Hyphomicrobiales bacterium]